MGRDMIEGTTIHDIPIGLQARFSKINVHVKKAGRQTLSCAIYNFHIVTRAHLPNLGE